MAKGEGGGEKEYHDYPTEFISLTVQKFRVTKNFLQKKGARKYYDSPSIFFVSQCQNIS